ncbi:5-(carboxyamino)imidazole ribonucleotide synthase [Piscinibacterium candidicorallinum]|uniref:N5-carboxyaminoimidazole ribonucleotide synthase n=1 Tax=Piscinibacterium candidicorallinum TaxID=1793872 RepID=A0ABV7H837_9BURK
MKTLAPGSWLGLLGGGQLGRMFCMAAQSLGYKVVVLDPAHDGPAISVADDHVLSDYLEPLGLEKLAARAGAVTTEFENVPAQSLDWLADRSQVSPRGNAVAIAQDRIAEKAFVTSQGIEVAPHLVVRTADDLGENVAHLLPGILKVARLGYDGKGQARVSTLAEAKAAFDQFGKVPCVLEKMLDLAYEVSVIVARASDGSMVHYPVAENIHRGGILAISMVPSPQATQDIAARALTAAQRIAHGMNYVGVLCVEFFVVKNAAGELQLLVNEMAPRPHNSGHYSIDACVTSQFEQQARIMAGLPLGSPRQHHPAVMINLLGDVWKDEQGRFREPDWAYVLREPNAKLHLYGKADARSGRKMGHITVLGNTVADALTAAKRIAERLGIERF